jgi:hypothetical protein
MTKKSISWQILGETVCNDVARRAVNQDDVTCTNTITQGVDLKINMFGVFAVHWIFRQNAARVIVLMERRRRC